MNDEGPDYRQQQECEELRQWLEEQDAKRRMRALEAWEEIRAGLDDNLGNEMADAENVAGKE